MGRNRSFDEDEVLEKAMHAFRRHGYAGLSIRRLEEATGLTSGSIYNAYGDKDGVYRAALARYVEGLVAVRIAAHAGQSATLEDLEQLFLTLFREPMTDGYGCLVTNSAVEFGAATGTAGAQIGRALDMIDEGIRAVLAREIGPGPAGTEAGRLVLLYHGILVLSRAGRISAGFEDAVRSQFVMLRQMRERVGFAREPLQEKG